MSNLLSLIVCLDFKTVMMMIVNCVHSLIFVILTFRLYCIISILPVCVCRLFILYCIVLILKHSVYYVAYATEIFYVDKS